MYSNEMSLSFSTEIPNKFANKAISSNLNEFVSMRNSNSMIDESKAGTRRLIESFNVFINYSNRHKPLKSELPLTEILLNIQHEIPFTMNGNT